MVAENNSKTIFDPNLFFKTFDVRSQIWCSQESDVATNAQNMWSLIITIYFRENIFINFHAFSLIFMKLFGHIFSIFVLMFIKNSSDFYKNRLCWSCQLMDKKMENLVTISFENGLQYAIYSVCNINQSSKSTDKLVNKKNLWMKNWFTIILYTLFTHNRQNSWKET